MRNEATEFVEEYFKRGFADIIVFDSQFNQSASSHWESTTETAIAKKDGRFFRTEIYESINFLKRGRDSLSFSAEEIAEAEHQRLSQEAEQKKT